MALIDDMFDVEGLVAQRKQLDALLMSNPAMEKKVQALIRKVLQQARKSLSEASRSEDVMNSDPRKAYKAVRSTVYRRILGGNVNILRKKKAGAPGSYEPTRTLKSHQRGGNRRLRSSRTRALQGYYGSDRGFILRFLNSGTSNRVIKFRYDEDRKNVHRGSRGGDLKKYGKSINTGFRGRIRARKWFDNNSQRIMAAAARELEEYIDTLIKNEIKG